MDLVAQSFGLGGLLSALLDALSANLVRQVKADWRWIYDSELGSIIIELHTLGRFLFLLQVKHDAQTMSLHPEGRKTPSCLKGSDRRTIGKCLSLLRL